MNNRDRLSMRLTSSKSITPLRQRMLEDMRMRKLKPATQKPTSMP
jgi:hypothetical protein